MGYQSERGRKDDKRNQEATSSDGRRVSLNLHGKSEKKMYQISLLLVAHFSLSFLQLLQAIWIHFTWDERERKCFSYSIRTESLYLSPFSFLQFLLIQVDICLFWLVGELSPQTRITTRFTAIFSTGLLQSLCYSLSSVFLIAPRLLVENLDTKFLFLLTLSLSLYLSSLFLSLWSDIFFDIGSVFYFLSLFSLALFSLTPVSLTVSSI